MSSHLQVVRGSNGGEQGQQCGWAGAIMRMVRGSTKDFFLLSQEGVSEVSEQACEWSERVKRV